MDSINPTEMELSIARKTVENIFQRDWITFSEYELKLLYHFIRLIVVLNRNERTSLFLSHVVDSFDDIVNPYWDDHFHNFFSAISVFNGVVCTNDEPINVVSGYIYGRAFIVLNDEEKYYCNDFAILLKELYFGFRSIKQHIEETHSFPRLSIAYELIKKIDDFFDILYDEKGIIKNGRILNPYRLSRNAESHISIVFSGTAFDAGNVIMIERDERGNIISALTEDYLKIQKEMGYIIAFMSQLLHLYPDLRKRENILPAIKEPGERVLRINYRSGEFYAVKKCSCCGREITRKTAFAVLPEHKLKIIENDDILETIYERDGAVLIPEMYFCCPDCLKQLSG